MCGLIAGLATGCFVSRSDDTYVDETYVDETYVDDRYVDETSIDETSIDESESVEEESFEESSEETTEEEETTTTTTTTTVETPGMEGREAVSCSREDQGFGDAELVESFALLPPENCTWREQSGEIAPELGLGFIDVETDDEYTSLFECGEQSIASDVTWSEEVVVYLSGWVPAGSAPEFQWSVAGEGGEVVLGLVSQEVCSDELTFYQAAFITPRRAEKPRVISCVEPVDCQ
jgi:hypothetical protein